MKKDIQSEILEEIIALSNKDEPEKWQKSVLRCKHGDNPITLDIRYKKGDYLGKGISLTDSEASDLADELVRRGYASNDVIREAVEKILE